MNSKNTKSDSSPAKTEKKKTVRKGIPVHGGYGLLILFVCASIAYANYRVFFGTTNVVDKLMLLPSTAFVVLYLVYKSFK